MQDVAETAETIERLMFEFVRRQMRGKQTDIVALRYKPSLTPGDGAFIESDVIAFNEAAASAIVGTRRQVRRRLSKLRSHEIHRDGWMATDDRLLKDTTSYVIKVRKSLPIGWRP